MTNHNEIYLDFMQAAPSAGVAFNNRVYLICPRHLTVSDGVGGNATFYWISITKCSVNGGEVTKDDEIDLSERFIDIKNTIPTNPAACVHQGILYVFWQENGMICYRQTADGKSWGKKKTTGSSQFDSGASQIAAVSTGDALIVFAPYKQLLHVAKFIDGTWIHEHRPEWTQVKGIAACTFLKDNEPDLVYIMYGMVTVHGNIWTGHYLWGNGQIEGIKKQIKHPQLANSNSLAVVQGSTNGGTIGNVVQLFSSDSKARRKQEFTVSNSAWHAPEILSGEYISKYVTGNLSAFQHFTNTGDDELKQSIWLLFTYNGWTGESAYAATWTSDQLKLIKKHKPQDVDERNKELWCLLGVVEGPPPYVLNGQKFFEKVSDFTFKYSEKDETSTRIESSLGAYISFGGKGKDVGDFGAGGGISGELTALSECKSTETVTLGLVKYPDLNKSCAIEIYLKPTVIRKDYEIQDYKGNSLNIHVYAFSVSQWSPDYFQKDLAQWPPNPANSEKLVTSDITSWLSRMTSVPSCADDHDGSYINRTVTWIESSEASFNFEKAQIEMNSDKYKVSFMMSAGAKDIFDIGVNCTGSITTSHQTTIGQSIGFTLRYPAPRNGEASDVRKVGLRVLLIKPREGQINKCYWIPENRKDQRPWCLCWSIDYYMTQSEKLFGAPPKGEKDKSL